MLPVASAAIAMPVVPVDGNPVSVSPGHGRRAVPGRAAVSAIPVAVADTDAAARARPVAIRAAAVNPIPPGDSSAVPARSRRVAGANPGPQMRHRRVQHLPHQLPVLRLNSDTAARRQRNVQLNHSVRPSIPPDAPGLPAGIPNPPPVRQPSLPPMISKPAPGGKTGASPFSPMPDGGAPGQVRST